MFPLLAIVAASGACHNSNESHPAVISELSCLQPNGDLIACELSLPQPTGFNVVLTTSSCAAVGNTLRLIKPVDSTLTTDGCQEPGGKTWEFPGPFTAGTKVAMEVVSAGRANPPALRVTGAYPDWLVEFEDGGDADFNDLILHVTATAAP